MTPELYLAPEHPHHTQAVEALNDHLFGPARHTKTVAQYRDGVDPIKELCLVALTREYNDVAGSIRYWPVKVGGADLIMLGPVSVADEWQGVGVGSALIASSLELAAVQGHAAVVLKCNADDKIAKYAKHGFSLEAASQMFLPGPNSLDESKLLMARDLIPGTLTEVSGLIMKSSTLHTTPVLAAMRKTSPFYPVLQNA